MQVLLIHPPLRVHREHIDYPAFSSLALWHNAAQLSARGFEVSVLDSLAMSTAGRIEGSPYFELGVKIDDFLLEMDKRDCQAAVVHLNPFVVQDPKKDILRRIVRRLRDRRPEIVVVFADMHIGGMNHIAYEAEDFLNASDAPDYLLRYEAEESLTHLLFDLESGKIGKNETGGLIDGKPLETLSTYGAAIYEQVDLQAYGRFLTEVFLSDHRPNPFGADGRTLPFKSSRGCKHSCIFCTSRPGRAEARWRHLPEKDLARQIDRLGKLPAVNKLWVLDEAANLEGGHFDRLLDESENAGLKLEFPNGLRADRLDENRLARLAERISLLSLSPESASTETLKLIGKGQNLESVEQAVRMAHSINLPVALHFIVGLPAERKKDITATFRFARRMFEDYGARPWVQFAVALPGTELFGQALKAGLLPDPLPVDYGPCFQGGPMLADGACEVSNTDLIRLKAALEQIVGD